MTDRSGCGLAELTILRAAAALSGGDGGEAASAKVLEEVDRNTVGRVRTDESLGHQSPCMTRPVREHLVNIGVTPPSLSAFSCDSSNRGRENL